MKESNIAEPGPKSNEDAGQTTPCRMSRETSPNFFSVGWFKRGEGQRAKHLHPEPWRPAAAALPTFRQPLQPPVTLPVLADDSVWVERDDLSAVLPLPANPEETAKILTRPDPLPPPLKHRNRAVDSALVARFVP